MHVSTAWRALKNDTYVATGRRAEIRAIAKRLGYTPDPMLSALSNYRRKLQPPAYRSTLAWVSNFPTRRAWQALPHIRAYHEGALAFAASQGYKLDECWLCEDGMSPKRAREVLLARGIRGLIFAPQPVANTHIDIDVEPFSCVSLGYSLAAPRLHVVTNHQHASTLQCLRQLGALGHGRIGLASSTDHLRRAQHNFEGAYCLLQHHQPESRRIPMFLVEGRDDPRNIAASREAFLAWFERHQPTAIVATFAEARTWLEATGRRVPDDVGLATLSRIQQPTWSGIDQQEREIGARAVELLISIFQSGERGVPATPLRLLVEGRWIDGGTVRPIGPPVAELLERLA